MKHTKIVVVTLLIGTAWTPGTAGAYTYESLVSNGCHESITIEAFRLVRAELGNIPELVKDDVLVSELPYRAPGDMRGLGAVALILGVRENDLKGLHGLETTNLSLVHGDPEAQREHCLRKATHDETNRGSEAAVGNCRDYIREMAHWAVEGGLGTDGLPDGDRRTLLKVHLAFSGKRELSLPVFYLYLGQALHALQDSFTHTMRTEDAKQIRTVFNWIDIADADYDERRDGPPHMTDMDSCKGLDERRALLHQGAITASTELIRAALNAGLTVDERKAAIDAVLDEWVSFAQGNACTFQNRWCDAPENEYRDPVGCDCRSSGSGAGLGVLLVLGFVFIRRSRRLGALAIVLLLLGAGPTRASAQPVKPRAAAPAPAPREAAACVPGRSVACACTDGRRGAQVCLDAGSRFSPCKCESTPAPRAARTRPSTKTKTKTKSARKKFQPATQPRPVSRFAFYINLGGALKNAAGHIAVAGRVRLNQHWVLGLDAEWNPWVSFAAKRLFVGAINIYATAIKRWPITRRISLRTTAHVGLSTLLQSLVGARAGSTGVYLGVSLIGVEVRLSRGLYVVVDPTDFALPIPSLSGVPLTYMQYRFTVGVQIGG